MSLLMSRRDIADHLGLTIEPVSRVIARLERENVARVISEDLQLMGSTERPLSSERRYKAAQPATQKSKIAKVTPG